MKFIVHIFAMALLMSACSQTSNEISNRGIPSFIALGDYVQGKIWTNSGGRQANLVYKLAPASAEDIRRKGLSFFRSMAYSRDHKTVYEKWKETPLISRVGDVRESVKEVATGNIIMPLNFFSCFDGAVEDGIAIDICNALTKPGSYYSYNNVGYLVVVLPNLNEVLYAENVQ